MIFIETRLFTKLLSDYLADEQYRELQKYLLQNPYGGDLIQETGGLRKLRWLTGNSKGKRGGVRITYYYYISKDQIYHSAS